MHRAHLPRSRFRPHEEILDDDEELDYEEIKDYEEAHPRPHRGGDRQLGGLGERKYQAGHHVAGNAGGMMGHPMREEPLIGPEAHPPRGPHSAMDPADVIEGDLEELDEQVTLLEVDLDLAVLGEDPTDYLSKSHDQPGKTKKKRYPGKYVVSVGPASRAGRGVRQASGNPTETSKRVSSAPSAIGSRLSGGYT